MQRDLQAQRVRSVPRVRRESKVFKAQPVLPVRKVLQAPTAQSVPQVRKAYRVFKA